MSRRLLFTGRVGGHFPYELADKMAHEPRPTGRPIRPQNERETKPFHEPTGARGSYASRLGGEWLYLE